MKVFSARVTRKGALLKKSWLVFIFLLRFPLWGDELWEKAISFVQESHALVPSIIEMESRVSTMGGKVKNRFLLETQFYVDENGKLKTRILKAIRDGKDITEEYQVKAQQKEKEDKKEITISSEDFDVFSLNNQKNIKIKRKGDD